MAAEKAGAEIFEKTRAVELLKIQNTDEERKRTGRSHKWQVPSRSPPRTCPVSIEFLCFVLLPALVSIGIDSFFPGYY